MPETLRNDPPPEKSPEASVAFSDTLDELERAVGTPFDPIEDGITERELTDEERGLTGDNIVETISEMYRVNELQQRKSALQRMSAMEKKDADPALAAEFITASQAATYYEYVSSILQDTLDVMRRYEQMRDATGVISPELALQEQQARTYLEALRASVEERIAFANVLLIDGKLSKHVGNTPDLLRLRESYLSASALSETSKRALQGGDEEKWRRGNDLNQRIIDILAGNARIPGVDEGFLPQRLHIALLQERYGQMFEAEKAAIHDRTLVKARARHAELSIKNDLAAQGKGEHLSAVEAQEYEDLRQMLADRNAYMDRLSSDRKDIQEEILRFTCRLGDDQMDRAELTTMQHVFAEQFDFEGISPPSPDRTPEEIRHAMLEQMEQRSQFHLERMGAFMDSMEAEVLDVGIRELAEDATNKYGHEAVRKANHALTYVLTLLVPEKFGLRDSAQETLTQPLDEALGWPAGKDTWEELSPEEQQHVIEKSQSVLDAIQSFDRATIDSFRQTVGLVESMPPASEYAGQIIGQPLPDIRVTADNREELIQTYGGATVYAMLFEQMDGDWNAFIGEYATFLEDVNTTIDTHFDVGEQLYRMGDFYLDLMKYLWAAALLVFGAGLLAGVAASKLARSGARLAGRAASGTARLGSRVVRGTAKLTGRAVRSGVQTGQDAVSALGRTKTAEELTRARYLERERQAMRWLEETKAGKSVAQKIEALRGGKLARGTGRVVKIGGWALVPAVTAYEYITAGKRAESAEADADLSAEYATQQRTAVLEGAGAGASLLIPGILPTAVLAAPVMYAASYNRARSEVVADWKRDVSTYLREFDSAGLRGKITSMTDSNAIEAGGGGALYPRIALPSTEDQQEAYELISDANTTARKAAYEAYLIQNLLVSPGTSQEEVSVMVADKMRYLKIASHGEFPAGMLNVVLQRADIYAQLMQRRRAMEQSGEEPVLSYLDERGVEHHLDLRQLTPGSGGNVVHLVSDYANAVQPAEEIIMAVALGEAADGRFLASRRKSEKFKAESVVRRMLLSKIIHHVHQAEHVVRSVDWPGVDSWLSSGNTQTQNIVRTYLAQRVDEKLRALVSDMIGGTVDPSAYNDRIGEIESILLDVKVAKDTDAFSQTASDYLKERGLTPRENALEGILFE